MSTSAIGDISVEEDAYIFPASFFQESLWFLDQLEPGSSAYNLAQAVRLSDLEAVPGISHETARRIYAHFHPGVRMEGGE